MMPSEADRESRVGERWKVGDVTIRRIVESEVPLDAAGLFPSATAEILEQERDWLYPASLDAEGRLRLSIHALLIESRGVRILVDTCIGNDKVRGFARWSGLKLPFLDDLARVGWTPESVDRVVCTHLHLDHVGWNTTLRDGRWVPTFPNARYLIGGTEWDFFSRSEDAFLKDPVEDSVRPVLDHGLASLIDAGERLTDEVWIESTPGHTPGHFAVRISSRGQDAVITGDLMHHPIQCRHPEWDDRSDIDGGLAKRTRREFCERYADSGALVFGTHFVTPSAGRIVRHVDAFRFVVA